MSESCDLCRKALERGAAFHTLTYGIEDTPSHVGTPIDQSNTVESAEQIVVCVDCFPKASELFDRAMLSLFNLRAASAPDHGAAGGTEPPAAEPQRFYDPSSRSAESAQGKSAVEPPVQSESEPATVDGREPPLPDGQGPEWSLTSGVLGRLQVDALELVTAIHPVAGAWQVLYHVTRSPSPYDAPEVATPKMLADLTNGLVGIYSDLVTAQWNARDWLLRKARSLRAPSAEHAA